MAARLVLVFALLGIVSSAQAQFSVGSPTCQGSTTSVAYSYTIPFGEAFDHWETRGDITISGSSSVSNVYTATVASTGPGRGRLTLFSTTGGCGAIPHHLEINKTFPQPDNSKLVGPSCVVLGEPAGFVVAPPIISTPALINAQIGIDTYDWDVTRPGPVNSGFPAGSGLDFSGDHSAVSLTLPTTFTGNSYELRVKVGACNPNSSYMTKTIYIKPQTPVLTVTNGNATCKNDQLPFTFSFSVQTGVKYTWNGIPSGWTIVLPNSTISGSGVTYATAGTQTATITPNDLRVADISVTASNASGGSCASSPSDVFRVTRQLTTADNGITASANGCLTPGSSVTFSFNHTLPSNTLFEWILPNNWTPTSSTSNSITVIVGTSPGNVTARVAGCGAGGTVKAVTVSGDNGCLASSYSIDRYGPKRVYFEVANLFSTSCDQGTGPGISYEWSSTNNPNPLHTTITTPYVTFANAEVIGQSVSVIIRNANTCLEVNVGGTVNRTALGSTSATSSTEPLLAYPNPAGNELHVDLDLKKGAAQLMLTDMLGRTVQQTSTKEAHTRLDVRAVPTGTYTLRAVLPDGKSIGKTVQVKH